MDDAAAVKPLSEASERFHTRDRWVDFINVAAAVPSFDFQNQLSLAHQVRGRQADITTFASANVWKRFGYQVRPGVEPFLVRSVATQDPAKSSIPVKTFSRGQVDGRGQGVPPGLSPVYVAQASSDGLSDRLAQFADRRGLKIVETDPAYLPNQVASLVHSRTEGVTRLLIRKDATEQQRCRGMVGTLKDDLTREAARHIRREALAEKKQATAIHTERWGVVADTSLIDSISGGKTSIVEVMAA